MIHSLSRFVCVCVFVPQPHQSHSLWLYSIQRYSQLHTRITSKFCLVFYFYLSGRAWLLAVRQQPHTILKCALATTDTHNLTFFVFSLLWLLLLLLSFVFDFTSLQLTNSDVRIDSIYANIADVVVKLTFTVTHTADLIRTFRALQICNWIELVCGWCVYRMMYSSVYNALYYDYMCVYRYR